MILRICSLFAGAGFPAQQKNRYPDNKRKEEHHSRRYRDDQRCTAFLLFHTRSTCHRHRCNRCRVLRLRSIPGHTSLRLCRARTAVRGCRVLLKLSATTGSSSPPTKSSGPVVTMSSAAMYFSHVRRSSALSTYRPPRQVATAAVCRVLRPLPGFS